jgi:hypothetical protein
VKIFVALTENNTYDQAAGDDDAQGLPYRGVWQLPLPEQPTVHVFAEHTEEQLRAGGWTREGDA